MTASIVGLFSRVPRPGHGKTRLLSVLSPVAASALQHALLQRALAIGQDCGATNREFWFDGEPDTLSSIAVAPVWRTLRQRVGDLGRRMEEIFVVGCRGGSAVVLYGSDCPTLGSAGIDWACERLADGDDAVLGPVLDGGYALIGMRHPCAEIFAEMPWGSASVAAETRRRWAALGWRWSELPYGWDVDRPEDLARLRRWLDAGQIEKAGPLLNWRDAYGQGIPGGAGRSGAFV